MVAAGILGDRFGAVPLLNVQAICYLADGVAALAGIADVGGSPRPDRSADSAEVVTAASASTKPGRRSDSPAPADRSRQPARLSR
jgi:hypothetical protein